MAIWLLKTEPSTYSFSDLQKDGATFWDGVRNFQARNFIRQIKDGDLALVYHSGDERAVVGLARVQGTPLADPDKQKPGDWLKFKIQPVKPLESAVPLKALKAEKSLAELLLLKQSRLSVMPVSKKDFDRILLMGSQASGVSR